MHIVVVGGGTATNAIAPVFSSVAYEITYILPISDNGGSTSEVLQFFGGPAIGDLRSRLVRLIKPGPLRRLLELRLSENSTIAANDWALIVDGTHEIWGEIDPYMKSMYRAFAIYIHTELLKRSDSRTFNFSHCSIGNLILSGARLFFMSLDAAIEFMLHTNRVPSRFSVLPCINTNQSSNIAARLKDGTTIVGQTEISHPSRSCGDGNTSIQAIDSELSFAHPSLQNPQILFNKTENEPLPSPIDRIYYVNLYGNEIHPTLYSRAQESLQFCDALVCSIGSLYTSIVPILLLQKFGDCLPRKVVVLLNGSLDRETETMRPVDMINAIAKAISYGSSSPETTQHITDVIYPSDETEVDEIQAMGINCYPAECINGEYNQYSLTTALNQAFTGS